MNKIAFQLDLFQERTPYDDMREEIAMMAESQDKVRRRIFKQHHDLSIMVMKMKEEIYELRMAATKRIK